MTAARSKPVAAALRGALAKVHIAKKDLGLDDGTYRAILERLTGHRSAAACTTQQLGLVLDEMKSKGWKPLPVGGRPGAKAPRRADHPMAGKARALWISLHQLGAVRDPSERALEAFAKRQLKVDRLQWADQGQGFRLIEALKALAERVGWSQDVAGIPADRVVTVLKDRHYLAMARRLRDLGGDPTCVAKLPPSARLAQLATEIRALLPANQNQAVR